jgi:hypothetical protein
MNRNVLYLILGALAVVVAFGYQLYRERQNTTAMEDNVGDRGIQKK